MPAAPVATFPQAPPQVTVNQETVVQALVLVWAQHSMSQVVEVADRMEGAGLAGLSQVQDLGVTAVAGLTRRTSMRPLILAQVVVVAIPHAVEMAVQE